MRLENSSRFHRLSWLHDIDVYEASFDNHVFGRHAHATFSVGTILEGVGGYRCRGSDHVLPVGALTLMNPEEVHTGRAVGGRLRYTMLYVGEAGITEMLGVRSVRGFRDVSPSDRSQVITQAVSNLVLALRNCENRPGWRLQVEELIHRLVLATFSQFGGVASIRPGNEPNAVRYLCDHIAAQIADDQCGTLSVTEVAASLSLHPNYLIQSFSHAKGISPYAYYMSRKINVAKDLISRGHHPLQVGLDLGFYDQSHFIRHFKKVFGVTPGSIHVH